MTTTYRSTRLRAVTREIERGRDFFSGFAGGDFAWWHDTTTLVGHGSAAAVPRDQIEAFLREIEVDDPVSLPGTGAVAVGALPFDLTADGHLVVPARVFGEVDGRAWVTEIGPVSHASAHAATTPGRFSVAGSRSRDDWYHAVGAALAAIATGELEKVVLAREVLVEADAPFDVVEVLGRLRKQQPGCFVYAAAGLVGASPELLVRRVGSVVESRPVAGTTVADHEDALRELAHSAKDNREHRFVVEAIADTLGAVCTDLDVGMIPDVAVFGPVAHLATPIRGRLADPIPSALELARALHPTPAVGGTPQAAALEAIADLEGFDRGRYAGPVGWVDAHGDGEWAIALRCAELDGPRARLVAGAGIVEGSDPAAEWAETQVKLEPMLRALIRP